MADSNFGSADARIDAGTIAGDNYESALESIRSELLDDSNPDNAGSSLGTMVGSQLKMTEAETKYQVESGLPKKASAAAKAAADAILKAAGG
jgi:hypothetical protein